MARFFVLFALVATTALASYSPVSKARQTDPIVLFTRKMAAGGSEPESRANKPTVIQSG